MEILADKSLVILQMGMHIRPLANEIIASWEEMEASWNIKMQPWKFWMWLAIGHPQITSKYNKS